MKHSRLTLFWSSMCPSGQFRAQARLAAQSQMVAAQASVAAVIENHRDVP